MKKQYVGCFRALTEGRRDRWHFQMATAMTKLCDLARKWTTDKALYYTPFYHSLFKDRRWQVSKVLEFGIGYPEIMRQPASRTGAGWYITGASLFMWQEYFQNAEIYALDNRPGILINTDRIKSFYCDQSDENSYAEAIRQIGTGFDFIIDDGSHVPEDQLLCAKMLVPLLAEGGIYVMEDAPVGDNDFLAKVGHPSQVVDFNEGSADPARLIVIRK